MTQEFRSIAPSGNVEVRERDGKGVIAGYAAVYNTWSEDLGGFREIIRPGAFDAALSENPDVYARVQHQGGLDTVGRTSSGTLRLTADSKGLWYEIDPPDTNAGRDLMALVKRGDISNSSFAFSLRGDKPQRWNFSTTPNERELLSLNIHDVAPVTGPAYQKTTCEARALSVAAYEEAKATLPESRWSGRTRVEVREDNDQRVAELYIMDIIVRPGMESWFDGAVVSGVSILEELKKAEGADRVDVYINSPGGAAFEGVAIYNMLRQFDAPVNVYVQGLAASAASVIAMAGNKISMGLGSQLMVHRAWNIVMGNARELRKEANTLDSIDNSIAEVYAARSKMPHGDVVAWMDEETWFGANAAVNAGLADEITGGDDDAIAEARSRDYSQLGFTRVPDDWDRVESEPATAEAQEPIDPAESDRIRDEIAQYMRELTAAR